MEVSNHPGVDDLLLRIDAALAELVELASIPAVLVDACAADPDRITAVGAAISRLAAATREDLQQRLAEWVRTAAGKHLRAVGEDVG